MELAIFPPGGLNRGIEIDPNAQNALVNQSTTAIFKMPN